MDRIIFLLISSFLTINAFAQQPTFFGSSPKQQSATAPTARSPRPVLSPSEFSSKVSEMTTKNDAAFKQHLNQQISQIPPPVIPKVPLPKASGATGTSPSTTTQMEEIITPAPAPTAAIPPPPAPQKAPPPESYSTTPPPSTEGSGTFTGFGTGSSSGTKTTPQKSQGSSGGGWNIKY